MRSIGEILKEERQRLGMNQDDFAAVGGLKRRAQTLYEQNERAPDALYLRALAAIGVDVSYILTGEKTLSALTVEEKELLTGYRGLDSRGKAGVLGMIGGMASTQSGAAPSQSVPMEPSKYAINPVFHGNVGQTIYGDVTSPNTVNMPKKDKKK
ncbi:helix-turn-helix transcriptional regulator [Janthinobacterium lividum]|uniref:Helix-turn-helix transcriptional regulator n=1 Tax=Janthinobacterium lividum TaxID=29581 RepID=A0A5C4NUW7_9BURK|nr:helix-turn-helix transcriptional regulator [Janthinobacterium lividum]TNC77535.1 helix-turn-helix transcriptional regulator [Janthinobacterium lividum]